MKQHKAEIEAIVNNPEEPTFENTIVALDKAGELLNRTSAIFFNLYEAMKNDEMQQLAMEISPAVTAHGDEINMNPKLFARIKALYDKRETLGLDALALRTLKLYYNDFVRGGANLNDADKAKMMQINGELAKLSLQYGDNLLKETNAFTLVVDNENDLVGLPETARTEDVAAQILSLSRSNQDGLSRMTEELKNREAEELVQKALTSGKLSAAQKDWGLEYALKDTEGFKSFLEKAPTVVPLGKLDTMEAPAKSDGVDMAVLKGMGISEEDYKKYYKQEV